MGKVGKTKGRKRTERSEKKRTFKIQDHLSCQARYLVTLECHSAWQVHYFVTVEVTFLEEISNEMRVWDAAGMNIPVVSQRSLNETRVLIDLASLVISTQPALTTRDRSSIRRAQCTTEAIPEHCYGWQETTRAQGCNWHLEANSPDGFPTSNRKMGELKSMIWHDLTILYRATVKRHTMIASCPALLSQPNFALIRKLGDGDAWDARSEALLVLWDEDFIVHQIQKFPHTFWITDRLAAIVSSQAIPAPMERDHLNWPKSPLVKINHDIGFSSSDAHACNI